MPLFLRLIHSRYAERRAGSCYSMAGVFLPVTLPGTWPGFPCGTGFAGVRHGHIHAEDCIEGSDMKSPISSEAPIAKEEYEAIAAFRYAIRRFQRFSEQAARREGITPQQHQLLLAIKGFPERDYASVSELANRLQMRQHSMVGLIDRTEAQGLVRREQSMSDRRQVFIFLTPTGEAMLQKLSVQHRHELRTMRDALAAVH